MSTLTTITGWVGTTPKLTEGRNGTKFTTVRVATTDRYRDAEKGWVDGDTQWFAVRLFGDFAQNAAQSVRRGDPVVVTGRFALDNWETEERSGSTLVLYASAMGHDLSRGTSNFARVLRVAGDAGTGEEAERTGEDSTDPADNAMSRIDVDLTESDPFAAHNEAGMPAEPVTA